MTRKKLILFLVIFCVILIPQKVNAGVGIDLLKFKCPSSAKVGEIVTCYARYEIDHAYPVVGFDVTYTNDAVLEFVSIEADTTRWHVVEVSDGKINVRAKNSSGYSLSDGVVELKLKLRGTMTSGSALLNIEYGYIYFADGDVLNQIAFDEDATKIKTINCDALLSSIQMDGKMIKDFDSNRMSYNLSTPDSKVFVSVNKTCPETTVLGDGNVALAYGKNKVVINTRDIIGRTREYVLNINREDLRDTNSYLKSLVVKNHEINFKKEILDYTLNVSNEVEKIELDYSADSTKARVVEVKNKKLIVGENIIEIVVKAENESSKTYKIVVNREEKNPELSSLNIKGFDISFDSKKYEYLINTAAITKKLDIVAEADKAYEIDVVGNENLKEGDNKIIIKVKNQSNKTTEYVISVVQPKKEIEQENAKQAKKKNFLPFIIGGILLLGAGGIYFLKFKKTR